MSDGAEPDATSSDSGTSEVPGSRNRRKPTPRAGRRRLPIVLTVLGGLALLIALPLAYLNQEVFNSSGFADNAVSALDSPAVEARLSEDLTQALVVQEPQLVSVEPVIKGLTAGLLSTPPVQSLVRFAAGQTYSALFTSDQGSIVIDLANVGVAVIGFVNRQDPAAAAQLSQTQNLILKLADRTLSVKLIKLAETVRFLALVLPLLALVLLATALAITRERRRTALQIGFTLVTVGVASIAAYVTVRFALAIEVGASDRGVYLGVFDAFLAGFPIWAFAVALLGAVIAGAAATITTSTKTIRLPLASLWEWSTRRPTTVGEGLIRSVALLAAAVLLFVDPLGFVKVAVIIVGAWFAYSAALILLGLLIVDRGGDEPLPRGLLARFSRFSLASVIGLVVLSAGLSLAFHLASRTGATTTEPVGCNGSKALCAKPFDRVVFPASHNSMSAAQSGFLNANQGLSIVNQLDAGIRGLLIDAYEGRRNDQGVVRTDLSPKAASQVKAILGPDGLAAVQRLAGSIAFGPIDGQKALFLCHVVCELGATDAVPEFKRIKDWLDRNPKEVIVIMIEDAAPADSIKQALTESGLAGMANAFDPRQGGTFPTLDQMISSDKRVWIMAEKNGDATGWYHRAYEVTQETPYRFASPAQLSSSSSCRPNRGGTEPLLFLINNWIETYPPNPNNASKVNREEFLLKRTRLCEKIRNRTANLLAVDFADRGDVVGAARVLNRGG
jgi:hypothetical protein